ncbi:hypothetical protein PPL_04176 [Heterostelium album PN500]|uniref:Uncharacterized protein n=1 Tax=Heterostelium pallidum (strain ATCC 26659 / Pp 5 / PN500) TaxID=670386 RepID=D3B685_HETP5|nr:hypothetical protein PPL_04176 [Heterostelium album PN500]EFA83383.1 hypothetical protein PPL_04176 [Heterostelium album PN500]|eukprot:XP_020435500.1 hypothetical protein PPL_04176 [Heterostelium album PN500]
MLIQFNLDINFNITFKSALEYSMPRQVPYDDVPIGDSRDIIEKEYFKFFAKNLKDDFFILDLEYIKNLCYRNEDILGNNYLNSESDSSDTWMSSSSNPSCMVYKEFKMIPKIDPFYKRDYATLRGFECSHYIDPLVPLMETFLFEPYTTVFESDPNWLNMYVQLETVEIKTGISQGHQDTTVLYNQWVHVTLDESNNTYRLILGQQSATDSTDSKDKPKD